MSKTKKTSGIDWAKEIEKTDLHCGIAKRVFLHVKGNNRDFCYDLANSLQDSLDDWIFNNGVGRPYYLTHFACDDTIVMWESGYC